MMVLIDINAGMSNHDIFSIKRIEYSVCFSLQDSSKDHIERKVMVLLALAEIAIADNSLRMQSALLPCLVMMVPLAWVSSN